MFVIAIVVIVVNVGVTIINNQPMTSARYGLFVQTCRKSFAKNHCSQCSYLHVREISFADLSIMKIRQRYSKISYIR